MEFSRKPSVSDGFPMGLQAFHFRQRGQARHRQAWFNEAVVMQGKLEIAV